MTYTVNEGVHCTIACIVLTQSLVNGNGALGPSLAGTAKRLAILLGPLALRGRLCLTKRFCMSDGLRKRIFLVFYPILSQAG